jgi:hypothetical protein
MRAGWSVGALAAVLQLAVACSSMHDCEPLVGPPDPCGSFTCTSGNYCSSDAGTPACVAAKPNGAPCVRAVECVSVLCQQGPGGAQCSPQLCL